jgi:4-amino-4-deoxy-L-arabinose transferase-like glycosyltransferase
LSEHRVSTAKVGDAEPSRWLLLAAIFAAVLLTHLPLLGLPYYWDEAGYYIPAAYDFFRTGSLIPFSTLSNAHPPLPSIYLAACWKLATFAPWVTRLVMCWISSIALLAVYQLAIVTTKRPRVAIATVVLTGLYPIWFAQSSLAHADMFAAAASLWALVFFLERRLWLATVCFSLAALSKETAIVTPLALAAWQLWLAVAPVRWTPASTRTTAKSDLQQIGSLLTSIVPLAGWYFYHWHRTGFIFGNPEYLRYNAEATLTPLRVLLAFTHRVLHSTAHMNLFVPVLLMFACMMLPPVEQRERISISDQMQFYFIILANLLFFSILGGALLTRYLLPLYPLILLVCVNTFYRRLREWPYLVVLSAVAFLAGVFINPPYRFAPEDNLAYRDVALLHQAAIQQIQAHYPHASVLTAWPATDELTKPELGYITTPMPVVTIDNFSLQQIEKAAQISNPYTVALIFSTKYDPPHLPFGLGRRSEALDTRFFDFHRDLPPEIIARLLGGKLVWRAERQGQWTAVLHFDRAQEAMQIERDRLPLHYNQP